jgi:hypothetical protein
VDTDPQCNLTSYLVSADVVDDLLDNSDGPKGGTVWSAVKAISEATGGIRMIEPIEPGIERLFLLPGDIRLSEFESDLNDFWAQCFQRKLRGYRGTTALSELVSRVSSELDIDFVFFDSGPNIGPLNRAVLLDCDFFVVPVACDLFSLRALKTLGRTLADWVVSWSTIADLAPAETYLLQGRPAFLGYIAEGFRVYAGQVTQQHSAFLSRIQPEVHSQIVSVMRQVDPRLAVGRQFKLGEVKHLGALIPASQNQGVPVFNVDAGSVEQLAVARRVFRALSDTFVKRVKEASAA